TCDVRLARPRIEFLLGHYLDSVIVWPACAGLGEMRGALRDRAVGDKLHGSDTYPFVAESGADAGSEHAVDVAEVKKAVDADRELSGGEGILIGKQIVG